MNPARRHAVLAAIWTGAFACGCAQTNDDTQRLRFWAMGREGEVVQELVREFERANPDVRVQVQQIPWSAAHEKLLTAFVGRSTPDMAQIGNTWIAEFVALRALEALDSWLAASSTIDAASYFAGIWDTNVIDGVLYGVPWYVDTKVVFYRKDLLTAAGYDAVPTTWDGWLESMHDLKRTLGPDRFAILLPVNEWPQPVILGLQAGSPLLSDDDTHGAFARPEFRRGFSFYLDLFRRDLAPPVRHSEVSNVYQEFARGYFAMYVTGPWNLGEFRRRLPADMQDKWATAAFPGPDGESSGVSLAGGASLAIFRNSRHKDVAWRLVEYLSQPQQQLRFYELTGDLPARREAWQSNALVGDAHVRAFGEQLQRVVSTPKIPEWELIASRVQERVEMAVRGAVSPDSALVLLDADVERILEKRRWLLERRRDATGTALP
jgi:multiple sugar transport system substrate-binding protein